MALPRRVLLEMADYVGCMTYALPPRKLALGSEDEGRIPDLIATRGTPMFFALMLLEMVYLSRKSGNHTVKCRFNDTIASIASGISQQAFFAAFLSLCPVAEVYKHIHKRFRIMDLNVKKFPVFTWGSLMLGCDLAYYWAHRLLHVFHVLWAGHSCHHSGEDYTLATALRQGMIQPLFTWIVQLPLALVFPYPAFAVHSQLNTLYQFWIHTELIGRLGPLEYVLNTPTHHRMHHRPPGNCNYAGVLIIWDRIFGTFIPETERLDYYGLAKSPKTFDTLELNVQHLRKWRRIPHASEICHCFATRAKHTWSYFRLQALFESIMPQKEGKVWELPQGKPRREKYDGSQLDFRRKLLVVLFSIFGAMTFLSLPVAQRAKRPIRAKCLLAIASILSLSSAGKLLDSGKIECGLREATAMSAILAVGAVLRRDK